MDKKDVKYWEKRKAQRMWEHMQSAEDTSDQIAKVYWKSAGYINHQLDEVYNRFKVKHQLSNAEAQRLLNRMHDKTSFNELKNLLKQETNSDEKKELLKLIESPAYSTRIQRLQDMQREIDELMRSTYHLEKERSTRHYTDLIQDSYYKSIYDIQHGTGLAFSFSGISVGKLDRLLKSKWSGVNYSQRIWNNTQKLAGELKEELLVNLVTGRTNREVAEIISNKFGSGAMEARRLVRTESCYMVNEMEELSYEECEIEKYMFIATLDKRTSEACREHDHKVYSVKDRQAGKNCPPMHPWCRSTTIAYFDDEALAGMERRARDPETGELYKVPGNMSYPEWYEKYVARDPKKVNAVTAYQNRHSDRNQYDRYKDIFRDDKNFKSFDTFQNMKYNESERWQHYKDSRRHTEMNNFISDSGYKILENISENEILVTPNEGIKIAGMSKHAMDNVKTKSDRKMMTQEKAQELIDSAKIVIFRKSNRTFKYIAEDGYCSINDRNEVVTAVPQKWRKKYDQYLDKE